MSYDLELRSFEQGLASARPASDPAKVERYYLAEDTFELSQDTGSGWRQITVPRGPIANRPASGNTGDAWIATDVGAVSLSVWTGAAWETVSGGGGGVTNTVAGDGVGTQNTGNDVDAVIAPIFGTGAGEIAEGDHGHPEYLSGIGQWEHVGGGALTVPAAGQYTTNDANPANTTAINIHPASANSSMVYGDALLGLKIGDNLVFRGPDLLIAGGLGQVFRVDAAPTDETTHIAFSAVTRLSSLGSVYGDGAGFYTVHPLYIAGTTGLAAHAWAGAEHTPSPVADINDKIQDANIGIIEAGGIPQLEDIGGGTIGLPAGIDGSLLEGIDAAQVGLGNVNNTADADKPVSTPQAAADAAAQAAAEATAAAALAAHDHAGVYADEATSPIVSSGAGVPSTTPTKVGNIYVDTDADIAYVAAGTATSTDWKPSTGLVSYQDLTVTANISGTAAIPAETTIVALEAEFDHDNLKNYVASQHTVVLVGNRSARPDSATVSGAYYHSLDTGHYERSNGSADPGGWVPVGLIEDGAIGTAQLADDAVTLAKMASGTADKLLGFDGSGNPAELDAPSGGGAPAYYRNQSGTDQFIGDSSVRLTSALVEDIHGKITGGAGFYYWSWTGEIESVSTAGVTEVVLQGGAGSSATSAFGPETSPAVTATFPGPDVSKIIALNGIVEITDAANDDIFIKATTGASDLFWVRSGSLSVIKLGSEIA